MQSSQIVRRFVVTLHIMSLLRHRILKDVIALEIRYKIFVCNH